MKRRTHLIPALIVLTLAFVIIFPLLTRLDDGAPITPGPESYLELRQAALLIDGNIGMDPVTYERFVPSLYPLLLAGMMFLDVPWLLPILLTCLLVVLVYIQLPAYMSDHEARLFALLVLIASPITSVFATYHVPALLALCLLLLASQTRYGWPLYVLALITSPVLIGLLMAIIIGRALFKNDMRRAVLIGSALLAGLLWVAVWVDVPRLGIRLSPLFFEFGADQGISIFILILAVFGLFVGGFSSARIASVIGFVLVTLVVPALLPATAIVLAAFAGHGIAGLFRHKWELDLLRQSLLILICCLGIFLVIVAAKERIAEQPTAELTRSMIYLSQQHREGKVLTDPGLSSLIIAFSDREPVTVPEGLFLSRNAEALYMFLESSGTNFIMITTGMREGMFSRSDEGILFLLPNTERFVLVNENDENQLWYYIRR